MAAPFDSRLSSPAERSRSPCEGGYPATVEGAAGSRIPARIPASGTFQEQRKAGTRRSPQVDDGADEGIRTPDPRITSAVLWPAELRRHIQFSRSAGRLRCRRPSPDDACGACVARLRRALLPACRRPRRPAGSRRRLPRRPTAACAAASPPPLPPPRRRRLRAALALRRLRRLPGRGRPGRGLLGWPLLRRARFAPLASGPAARAASRRPPDCAAASALAVERRERQRRARAARRLERFSAHRAGTPGALASNSSRRAGRSRACRPRNACPPSRAAC